MPSRIWRRRALRRPPQQGIWQGEVLKSIRISMQSRTLGMCRVRRAIWFGQSCCLGFYWILGCCFENHPCCRLAVHLVEVAMVVVVSVRTAVAVNFMIARERKLFFHRKSFQMFGWLSKLWSLFGYPKYWVPYYNRDPEKGP